MKKSKLILAIFFIVAVVSGIFISSCDIKSPTEGIEVRLKGLERTTVITVQIYDAASGNQVDQQVTVNFSGANANKVISSSNQPITSLTTNTGNIVFSLKDEIVPNLENPVSLVLLFTSNGYINSSKQITIFKTGGSSYDMFLTNVNNTPQGVVTNLVREGSTGSSGLTAPITISSGLEPNSNSGASISVPAGTQLLDVNGNVLTGNVETRVTYFNPLDQSSLNSFPGGFEVSVQNETGQQQDVQFITAGFVSIDMTVNGTSVEGFSQSATITFDIPDEVVNPETGQNVKAGDVIPLWSYDEDNGEWKWEGNYTVPARSARTGKMQIKKENVTHLSYWNLDWYSDMCYYGTTIRLIGCFDRTVIARIIRQSDNSQISYKYIYSSDPNFYFYRAPQGLPVRVEFYEYVNYWTDGQKVGEVSIDDLCVEQTLNVNIDVPGLREITINITGKCTQTDPPRVFYPQGIPLYYKVEGTYSWINAGNIGSSPFEPGQIKLCLKENTDYIFTAYIDGQWYYSSNYPDAPKRLEPGKTVYNFTIEDPDVGSFCN